MNYSTYFINFHHYCIYYTLNMNYNSDYKSLNTKQHNILFRRIYLPNGHFMILAFHSWKEVKLKFGLQIYYMFQSYVSDLLPKPIFYQPFPNRLLYFQLRYIKSLRLN